MKSKIKKKLLAIVALPILFLISTTNASDLEQMKAMKAIAKQSLTYSEDNYSTTEPISISDYETVLPNDSQARIPFYESKLLSKYLDNPNNVDLSKMMAVYHIFRSPTLHGNFNFKFNRIHKHSLKKKIYSLKTAIYIQYFLHRAKKLGAQDKWIDAYLSKTQDLIDRLIPVNASLDHTEQTYAQELFFRAFNLDESLRYKADYKLFAEVIENPGNILSNLYLSAVNLWNGSEAAYDDPNMLYFYIICSFFAERTQLQSQQAEKLWEETKGNTPLFRLVSSIGGFTLPARRWLAKLHGDNPAVQLIDEEMLVWLERYPDFYAWPQTVIPMHEENGLMPALAGYLAGVERCGATLSHVCGNTPRAPFNVISFHLLGLELSSNFGAADWFNTLLAFESDPYMNYSYWILGHEAWDLRKNNFETYVELYTNDDPSDNPVNAFINRQKWGISSTCQMCHQYTDLYSSDEERNAIPPKLSDEELHWGTWPAYTVSWYAEIISD